MTPFEVAAPLVSDARVGHVRNGMAVRTARRACRRPAPRTCWSSRPRVKQGSEP